MTFDEDEDDPLFSVAEQGVAEQAATEAFNNLNKLKNEPYMAYLKRKLGEWYREAPKPVRQQPVLVLWPTTRRANPRTAATPPGPPRPRRRRTAVPPLKVATVLGFHLISKVFRPEFESRRIEHRDRTGQHGTDRAA